VTIVEPTRQLLSEIADTRLRQKDVAQTLALCEQYGQLGEVDLRAVALAAMERWSRTGWQRIKTLAQTGQCWDIRA